MDPKTMIKAIKKTGAMKHRTLQILNAGIVTNGTFRVTDLDTSVRFNVDTDKNGMADLKLFCGSGDLDNSFVDLQTEDFPLPPPLQDPVSMDPAVFNTDKLFKVSKCVSHDITRSCLTGIFLDSDNNNVIATDGHRLLETSARIDKSFIMPLPAVEILNIITKESPVLSAELGENSLLRLTGSDFEIIAKTVEGPYPDYKKVIPENDRKTVFSPDQIADILAAIKELKPVLNKKTSLIRIGRNYIRGGSYDIDKYWQVNFSDPLFPENENYQEIGFNGLYMADLLSLFDLAAPITFKWSKTHISALTINQGDQQGLIMPLRIMEIDKEEGEPEYTIIQATGKKPRAKRSTTAADLKKEIARLKKENEDLWQQLDQLTAPAAKAA